jgi:hypothetical protein
MTFTGSDAVTIGGLISAALSGGLAALFGPYAGPIIGSSAGVLEYELARENPGSPLGTAFQHAAQDMVNSFGYTAVAAPELMVVSQAGGIVTFGPDSVTIGVAPGSGPSPDDHNTGLYH